MYRYLTILLFLSTSVLYSAQHNQKWYVTCACDPTSKSITYIRGVISNIAFIATKTDNTYKASLTDCGDALLDLSSSEEALKQFWILQAEHAAQQTLLEKSHPQKTCTREEERTDRMRITKYTQKKDGVTLSAQCIRMCDRGKIKKFFGSSVSRTDDKRSAKELFAALEQIYRAENPA